MSVIGPEARVAVPPDLQELIDALEAVEQDAERIVAPLDDEQFNWSQAPGSWSIAQCLDHLNAANGRVLRRGERGGRARAVSGSHA